MHMWIVLIFGIKTTSSFAMYRVHNFSSFHDKRSCEGSRRRNTKISHRIQGTMEREMRDKSTTYKSDQSSGSRGTESVLFADESTPIDILFTI